MTRPPSTVEKMPLRNRHAFCQPDEPPRHMTRCSSGGLAGTKLHRVWQPACDKYGAEECQYAPDGRWDHDGAVADRLCLKCIDSKFLATGNARSPSWRSRRRATRVARRGFPTS